VKNDFKGNSTINGSTMGTTYSVKIYPQIDDVSLSKLKKGITYELELINNVMSTYRSESKLSLFNKAKANQAIFLENSLFEIIKRALQVNRETEGAFDVTVGPLVNLWGFGAGGKRRNIVPDKKTVDELLVLVGSDKLVVDEERRSVLKNNEKIYVDLSAIAKGYGVDEISRYLSESGYTNHMVEIGGEIRVKGFKGPKTKLNWKIAIEVPNSKEREEGRVLELSDVAMATSGDYRNFFTVDGKRYSHTIDPRTGGPITHNLTSVTVLYDNCMDADAYATALMVMGEVNGPKWANENNIMAIFYAKEANGGFKEIVSNAMKKNILEKK